MKYHKMYSLLNSPAHQKSNSISALLFLGVLAATLCTLHTPVNAQQPVGYLVTSEFVREISQTRFIFGGPTAAITHNGITFNVWFQDVIAGTGTGFDAPGDGVKAQARMLDALIYTASVMNESGTLDVFVDFSDTSGTGYLAAGGTYFSGESGFSNGSAYRRLHNDEGKVFGFAVEEIYIKVNMGYDFNLDSIPLPGAGIDLQSVLLHEIGHGLGILSLSDQFGNSQIPTSAAFTGWDAYMQNEDNEYVFSGFPPALAVSSTVFTSNALYFNGPASTAQFGDRPPLFAPSTYIPGSSLGHWNEGSVGASVMQPLITGPGDISRRAFSDLDKRALEDLGWNAFDHVRPPNFDPRTISGQILTFVNQPIVGVTMTGWPGDDDPPVTDGEGYYEGVVDSGWTGTIIPAKNGYIFDPVFRNYVNLTTNSLNQDYTDSVNRSLFVTAPNEAVDVEQCSVFEITWNSNGIVDDVILIQLFSQLTYTTIEVAAENTGSYLWTVPSDLAPMAYQIRLSSIQSPIISDFSDTSFFVVPGESPEVVDIRRKIPDERETASPAVTFEVEFNKPVIEVTADDFEVFDCTTNSFLGCTELLTTGAFVVSVTSADDGAGILWDVYVSTGVGRGIVGIEIPVAAAITDACGMALLEPWLIPPTPNSELFYNVVDGARPEIIIGEPAITIFLDGDAYSQQVVYPVTYTGADSVTLNLADIVPNLTGTAGGTITVVGDGDHLRLITITDLTGTGTMGISINASTASILGGQFTNAAGPSATFDVPLPEIPLSTRWALLVTIIALLTLSTIAIRNKKSDASKS